LRLDDNLALDIGAVEDWRAGDEFGVHVEVSLTGEPIVA
jgi:hypothetical protein